MIVPLCYGSGSTAGTVEPDPVPVPPMARTPGHAGNPAGHTQRQDAFWEPLSRRLSELLQSALRMVSTQMLNDPQAVAAIGFCYTRRIALQPNKAPLPLP